jgi:hypothetical protein
VFEAHGLGDGPHTLTITVTGTANPAATNTLIEIDAIDAQQLVVPVTLERFEEDAAGVVFSSGWSTVANTARSGGAYKLSGTAGRTMEVSFTGPAVRWIGTTGPSRGIAEVTLNGTVQPPVDLYADTWTLQQPVFEAHGLGDGPHTLTITVTGTANPAATNTLIEIDAIDAQQLVVPVTLERFEEDAAGVVFSSGWSTVANTARSGGAYKLTGTAGRTMEVSFTGPAVRWIGTTGPSRGIAEVTLNGTVQPPVDLYADTWTLQQPVFEAHGLGDGPHTLTITVTGTANPAATNTLIEIDAIDAQQLHLN